MKIFAIISSIFAGATGIQVSTKKPDTDTEKLDTYTGYLYGKIDFKASIQASTNSPDFAEYTNICRNFNHN